MWQTGVPDYLPTALRQTMKNRFLNTLVTGDRKRFLTTCLTTDRRGVCGNSGGKSCEERPQQSENGYKAPEKVEKFLFKSLWHPTPQGVPSTAEGRPICINSIPVRGSWNDGNKLFRSHSASIPLLMRARTMRHRDHLLQRIRFS